MPRIIQSNKDNNHVTVVAVGAGEQKLGSSSTTSISSSTVTGDFDPL